MLHCGGSLFDKKKAFLIEMNWTFELKKPSPIKWHWVLMMTTTTDKDDESKPLDNGSEEGATSMRFDNLASFLMVWLRRSSLVSGWSRPLIWWAIARREPENSPCYYIRFIFFHWEIWRLLDWNFWGKIHLSYIGKSSLMAIEGMCLHHQYMNSI